MSSSSSKWKITRRKRLPSQSYLCRLIVRMRPNIENLLIGSGISKSLNKYCDSIVIPFTIGLPAGLMVLGFVIGLSHGLFVAVAIAAALAVLGLALSVTNAVFTPAFRHSSRGDVLEAKFHAFASTLAFLVAGGESLAQALLELAKYKDDLKEFSVEIDYLHKSISLGEDPAEVLRRLSQITPSRSVQVLMESLAKAIETGSDPLSVIRYQLETYTNYYYSLVDRISSTIGTLLEMFLSLGLILPILVTIAALLFAAYAVKGLSPMSMVVLAVFIVLPIVSVMTVILVDNQMSKLKL
ncbi:MAG: type II secretion system F family protein [Acidilobus sp.]